MLIMQDALQKNIGVVCDVHLTKVFIALRWTDESDPDKLASEIEGWVDEEYWPKLNEFSQDFDNCGKLRNTSLSSCNRRNNWELKNWSRLFVMPNFK